MLRGTLKKVQFS
jgi:hypothetical protein